MLPALITKLVTVNRGGGVYPFRFCFAIFGRQSRNAVHIARWPRGVQKICEWSDDSVGVGDIYAREDRHAGNRVR